MNFVANFIRFPTVQKFWKSVNIWQSYRQWKGGNFLRHSVVRKCSWELLCLCFCCMYHVCWMLCRDSTANVAPDLVVINVYCPRAEPGNAERLEYKLRFYRLLQLRAEAILDSGRWVVHSLCKIYTWIWRYHFALHFSFWGLHIFLNISLITIAILTVCILSL